PLSIWLVWLYCRSNEMGLPDPIRSDVDHSFSVLIRIPNFSFFYYVFQLQHRISGLVAPHGKSG
ncbi:MAG: hypothetical protein V3V97_10090, partial [Hyphomicrobiaceae bacterium]